MSQAQLKSGYLYVFYNESFLLSYGENVYKLGRTKNLNNRISTYNTSFIKDSKYLISSRLFNDSSKAEYILFFLLRKFRIRDKREFFNIDINILKTYFERLNNFSDKMIDYIYNKLNSIIIPQDFIQQLDKNNINIEDKDDTDSSIQTDEEWSENVEKREKEINIFFDKFKYIPKK